MASPRGTAHPWPATQRCGLSGLGCVEHSHRGIAEIEELVGVTRELPGHLTPRALSETFGKSLHAPAFVLLIGATVIAVTLQAQTPTAVLWPAMLAPAVMIVLLALMDHRRTTAWCLLYLLGGGLGVFVYALTLASQFTPTRISDMFIVVVPESALILLGGSGAGAGAALRWCAAGYLVAQTAGSLALLQARGTIVFVGVDLGIYLGISLILILHWFSRSGDWRTQPRLNRAERDEYRAAIRRRAEVEAAAQTHDTILNHLAVIATSPSGAPSPQLRLQIETDLAALNHIDPAASEPPARASWERGPLAAAIRAAEEDGLTIDLTGDASAVLRLGAEAASTLALAVTECLTNVARHSGVAEAEIAVDSTDNEVVVLVVDAGCGFDPSQVPADRLGIKNSVRGRIEALHGTVAVWSVAGAGTSVVIYLPLDPRPTPPAPATPASSPSPAPAPAPDFELSGDVA